MTKRILFLAVGCLGISAFVTQLTLLRELLGVFSGNELVFGIVLGNWLLWFGIGAALGRTASRLKRPAAVLVAGQIVVAVLPIAVVFLLRTLRNVVFLRGAEVGVTETVAACSVLLAPYCLIAGYLLTLACLLLAERRVAEANRSDAPEPLLAGAPLRFAPATHHPEMRDSPPEDGTSLGQVYFLDNVGCVLGGLLFTFVLVHLLDHFRILYVPALLNLGLAVMVAWGCGRRWLAAAPAAVAVALIALASSVDLDALSTRIQYAPQHVVFHGHSPYGSLVVTRSAGQFNFIENGVPLFSTHNVEEVEETVHYAMAQRPDARRVLLIAGGVSGTAREILEKYRRVEAVDYVELDPLILSVAARYVPESLADPDASRAENRIRVQNTDGRLFVKRTADRYDVVIVDVPAPSTSQLNRFYTREFYEEVKRVLAPEGVVSFSAGTYEDYLSPELADLIAVAHRTAGAVFDCVLILPGGRVFFLASDGDLTADVAGRIEQAGVENRLMNRHYLGPMLTTERLTAVGRAVAADAPINEDFNPILYYCHLRCWIRQFQFRFGLLEAGLLVVLAAYLVRIRPVPLVIFTAGFAASALEVVLLLGLQILYGCAYHQVGLIVTMFMLGLGIGSLATGRYLRQWSRRSLVILEVAIALYAALLPLALIGLGRLGGSAAAVAAPVAVPLLTLVLAVLVGMEFPVAGRLDYAGVAGTAARLFTADFIGAALGALLVSTLLIPTIGVTAVCLLAAAMNLVAAVIVGVTG